MTSLNCNYSCKACHYKDFSLEEGRIKKEKWLKEILSPWKDHIIPLQCSDDVFHYREKATLQAEYLGEWKIGLTQKEKVIEIPDCQIHSKEINKLIKEIKKILPPYDFFPLHHIVISKKAITFVLKTKKSPLNDTLNPLITSLENSSFESLFFHLNPSCGKNIWNGKKWQQFWGKENLKDHEGLFYGPSSFSQLIYSLHEKSLEEVLLFFDLKNTDKIVDLYSGNGKSFKTWKKKTDHILGVEISKEGTKNAQKNFPEIITLRGLSKDRLPQIKDFIQGSPYILYANPPRTGLEKEVNFF